MGIMRSLSLSGIALVLTAATGRAQCPTVPASASASDPNRVTSDACNKAYDSFQLLAPQLSAIQAGGNPSPSIGGTLGGFPHFNLGARVNIVNGVLPRTDKVAGGLNFNGAQSSNIPADRVFLAMPTVDAQIGLFKGFKLGLPIPFLGITNILGVDALLNAAYLPSAEAKTSGAGIALQGGQLAVGYGLRVGIFEESLLAPGLSFSVLTRPTPSVSVVTSTGNDSLSINDFKLTTNSWRLTASKTIPIIGIGVSAGYGQDKIDATTSLALVVNEAAPINRVSTRVNAAQAATRTNYFVGAHWKILLVRFAGEVGYVSGGTDPVLRNAFQKDGATVNPMDKRMYASIAARIGL